MDRKTRELERKSLEGDRESEQAVRRERCRSDQHCDHAPMAQAPIIVPKLTSLWYENNDGERWHPPRDGERSPPEGFIYQHSRFASQLTHSILRMVVPAEVEACEHLEVRPTGGWIDGIEGRECANCQGSQTRQDTEPWPDEWDAHGSRQLMTGSMGWSRDMATELVKHGIPIRDAILFCAVACERCMNIALWGLGLPDGYPADSEEASRAGTSCEVCDGRTTQTP